MPDSNRSNQPVDQDNKLNKGLFSHQVSDESTEMEVICTVNGTTHCKDDNKSHFEDMNSSILLVKKDSSIVKDLVPLKKKKKKKTKNVRMRRLQRQLQKALLLSTGQGFKKQEEEISPYQGFVGRLAPEITEIIFKLLNPEDLASCSLVCKSWRDSINSDVLWRHHCKQRGWTRPLTSRSCFQKSSHYWMEIGYLPPDLYPLCPQRLYFNRYAMLKKNWERRNFNTYYITKEQNIPKWHDRFARSSLACDYKHLVLFNTSKTWSIYNIESKPYEVDSELIKNKMVTNIRICSNTVAIVQEMVLLVYINRNNKFTLAYSKHIVDTSSENYHNFKNSADSKICIELSNDYLVSSVDVKELPTFIWDRDSGHLIAQIPFDSNICGLVNMYLDGNFVYFLMENILTNRTIVVYDIKHTSVSFTTESFDKANQLLINSKYICSLSQKRQDVKNICVFNIENGDCIRSIHCDGKLPSLVDDQMLYCHNTGLTIETINVVKGTVHPVFNMDEMILCMKPIFDNLLVTCGSTRVMVLDWILRTPLYTAYYPISSSIHLWVDFEKILLKLDKEDIDSKVVILKF